MGAARERYSWRKLLRTPPGRIEWRLVWKDNFAWMICALRGHQSYNTALSQLERVEHACWRCGVWLPYLDPPQDPAYCLLDGVRCDLKVAACWCEHCSRNAKVANPPPWLRTEAVGRANEREPLPAPVKKLTGQLTQMVGGKVEHVGILPDGSGFATMSYPLPEDHWLHAPSAEDEGLSGPPPMPFRMGTKQHATLIIEDRDRPHDGQCFALSRENFAERIRAAGRYAVRASTMNGRDMDFDPDALLQNLIVGMLGYWTEDGLTGDEWDNPPHLRDARRSNGDSAA